MTGRKERWNCCQYSLLVCSVTSQYRLVTALTSIMMSRLRKMLRMIFVCLLSASSGPCEAAILSASEQITGVWLVLATGVVTLVLASARYWLCKDWLYIWSETSETK